jgi:uncharacterized protein YjiS (DUF1127 family)
MSHHHKSPPGGGTGEIHIGSFAATRPLQGISPKLCSFSANPAHSRRDAVWRRQMSLTMFRLPPSSFTKHDDAKIIGTSLDGSKARKQKPKRKVPRETEAALLRKDHIVLLAIDGLLVLQAAIKRYLMRRRAQRILATLDDRQLKDVGLTRDKASHQISHGR